ncbi:hypothetical protein [Arthrobacter sp. C9C5]|uniref:hypothetical protein n=1 Tax=Arthrobacter sp. C9C5 TaxID=2735267 RepID=UPI001584D974|nr:hypothetical protein [Arthrobacter sp. C9C5]NUU30491.1 hypothetical protein [Arthrobacter sp. C9C5]
MNTPEPAGSAGDEIGAGVDMKSLWTLLDPGTRQWLMDHTGSVVVPRTVTAAMCRESEQVVPQDAHGQAWLNEDDMQFIRTRAHSAFAEHGTERLYEAVQPRPTRLPPDSGHDASHYRD